MERARATSKRILIVDDHGDSAEFLARLLKFSGHQVAVAPTCQDALRLVTQETFDLYLIDIGLPDGDGCDLLRKLLAVHRAPAIALTGYGMPADIARGIEAGFLDYLVKPIAAPKLEAVISTFALPRLVVSGLMAESSDMGQ